MLNRLAQKVEKVISALVVGSLAFAFFPQGVVPAHYNFIYQFVERYYIVGILLVIFSIPALLRLVVPPLMPEKELMIRNVTNFTLAVGYLFFTILSALSFGLFQVNWLNVAAISVVSGMLYVNSRLVTLDGRN